MPKSSIGRRLPTAFLLAFGLCCFAAGAQAAPEGAACMLPSQVTVDTPFVLSIPGSALPQKLDYGLLYYRNMMNSSWKTVFIKALPDGKSHQAVIPGQQITKPGIELYVVAYDKRGKESAICFSKNDPGLLRVDTSAPAPLLVAAPVPAAAANPTPAVDAALGETGAEALPEAKPLRPAQADAPLNVAPNSTQLTAKPQAEAEIAPKALSRGSSAPVLSGEAALNEDFALFTHETEAKVLSASKVEMDISRSPSTITVITAEELKNYGSDSLVEVLRTVPGMDYMEISHTDKELNVRGFNREGANKLLVLIDGRSVSIDLLGVTFWESLPISVEDVERIEIIRGPASTLYGNSAFSGVVSIYTKRPEDIKGALYRAQAGPYSTSASAVAGARGANYGYKATLQYKRLSSYDDHNVNDLEGISGTATYEHSFSKDVNFTLRGGVEKDDIAKVFSLVGPISTHAIQGYANANMRYKDFSAKFGWATQRGDLGLNVPLPSFVVSDPAYFVLPPATRDSQVLTINNSLPQTPNMSFSSNSLDLELLYSKEFASIDRLSVGTSFHTILFNSTNLGDDSNQRYQAAAYFQNELYAVNWLAFTAGFRYDLVASTYKDETTDEKKMKYWHAFSPRGALIFLPDKNNSLRVSGGLAFRTPAFFESNMSVDMNNISMVTSIEKLTPPSPSSQPMSAMPAFDKSLKFSGNRNLKPEKLYSLELSYSGRYINRLELNVDSFFNWYRDLILFSGDPEKLYWMLNPFYDPKDYKLRPFGFNNNVKANNTGLEVALKARITNWLKGFFNGSYQYTWVTNEDELIKNYIADKNEFYKTIPTQYTQSIMMNGTAIKVTNYLFDNNVVPFQATRQNTHLSDITTVNKENPNWKFNLGFNTQYKGFRGNLYASFVSATERQTFLTRLAAVQFSTFAYNPNGSIMKGDWFRYKGQGPIAIYTKAIAQNGSQSTTVMSISKVPMQWLLNLNLSYAVWDGKIEFGFVAYDLLHLHNFWKNSNSQGFKVQEVTDSASGVKYQKATGIADGRYIQYPRTMLFGKVMGGETIPTRVMVFIRGQI